MLDRATAPPLSQAFPRPDWPRPPHCLVAGRLDEPPQGARIAVAGLVILRQRPGTAKGVIFVTLEDETGVVNVIVWRHVYERFRRAVIAGRMLRVTGRLQRDHGVTHVLAETIEDISPMLDLLADPDFRPHAGAAPVARHEKGRPDGTP
ncbi:OB-fold nucleic acid binding domain-containing protein [Sulfitobacter sp. D35]|uniref:OB-fold nucleic acid binding domain-containing protein n=1 Tax=Sulfitobacter sp. D35 TaxID=3083252 RepID=UPI00296FFD92|nr:OB-fold nucleic acid binding domain-containing protein [Sulfitobacter sp. D35]MDW4499851.1 OB-fold nucleic acid binding domain-containing protein [Sulfitobacter sp. D35]